jgi:hypothetical protein
MAGYSLLPGSGISVPYPQVGEALGELAGTPAGTVLDAIAKGAAGTGPIAPALDWLEQNGGPFASGFIKGLRRGMGGTVPPPTGLFSSPCELSYLIRIRTWNLFASGDAPNNVWTRGQTSFGGLDVRAQGDGVSYTYVDSNGAQVEGFYSFPAGISWESRYGPATYSYVSTGAQANGQPCQSPPGQPPIPPSPTAPVVPSPPAFNPTYLPVPVAPGGPMVLAPVVPIIPVFIDADLNINADFNFDIRPTLQVGPFNIQIGPSNVEIYPSLPGRESPRLPPGNDRPNPTDPVPPTRPPAPSPPENGKGCESVWTKTQVAKVFTELDDIKECACDELGDEFVILGALNPSATITIPKGKRIVVRISVNQVPVNAKKQWGGGSAPDVLYAGWWSYGPNGAGERLPIHYFDQQVPIGNQPASFKVTVTLYEGYSGTLSVTGYEYPD